MKRNFFLFALAGVFGVATAAQAQMAPVSPEPKNEVPEAAQTTGASEKPEASSEWSNHFQSTSITQTHSHFTSPYHGPLSLQPTAEIPTSFTATLFIGHRLWKNAYVFANPEESAGSGIGATHGIAGFPNGEIYRVDDPSPKTNLSRLFFQQDFELQGEKEKLDDDANQFEQLKSVDRLTVVAGKFSLNDYFDGNSYSHDPRSQFFNWALMDTGAWDYAADTRGYTWGVYSELHLTDWSFRFALVQVPTVANGLSLEGDLKNAHAENLEIERRFQWANHPGKIRFLSFSNQANMGNYRDAIQQAKATAMPPDITKTRSYSTKFGFALNAEQEMSKTLGLFARLGWNNGATETWAFTEIDRSLAVGLSLKGAAWKRNEDVFGFALIANELSGDHKDYLAAGGIGFMIGDGQLHYATEEIVEAYYAYQAFKGFSLSPDLQFVNHPGYNSDRGPLMVYGLRLHYEI